MRLYCNSSVNVVNMCGGNDTADFQLSSCDTKGRLCGKLVRGLFLKDKISMIAL